MRRKLAEARDSYGVSDKLLISGSLLFRGRLKFNRLADEIT